MKLNDFLDVINDICNVGIMILDDQGTYYAIREYDYEWLSRDCRLTNLSDMTVTKQLDYLRSQNYDIKELSSYFWDYDFLVVHVANIENKMTTDTCTRSFDNGSPMTDEYWYYGTSFGCGKTLIEVKQYSHHGNPRSTTHFKYCPYCGKKLSDS